MNVLNLNYQDKLKIKISVISVSIIFLFLLSSLAICQKNAQDLDVSNQRSGKKVQLDKITDPSSIDENYKKEFINQMLNNNPDISQSDKAALSQITNLPESPNGPKIKNDNFGNLDMGNGQEVNFQDGYYNFDSSQMEAYKSIVQDHPEYLQAITDAQEYLTNAWQPMDQYNFTVDNNLTTIQNSIQNSLVQQQAGTLVVNNDYSTSDTVYQNTNITQDGQRQIIEKITKTELQSIFERSVTSGNYIINETKKYTGESQLKLIPSSASELANINIPFSPTIVDKPTQTATTTAIPTNKITKYIDIGYDWMLPGFDWRLTVSAFLLRFIGWARFEAGFRFVFPVKLEIEYPTQLTQNQSYWVSVNLTPIDKPNYDEFYFGFEFDTGFSFDINTFFFGWHSIFGFGIDIGFTKTASYKTPLAGEKAPIDFNVQIDFVSLLAGDTNEPANQSTRSGKAKNAIKALSKYFGAGLGVSGFDVYGNSVVGDIGVSINNVPYVSTETWKQAGVKTYSVDQSVITQATNTSVIIRNFAYVINKLVFHPYLFFLIKPIHIFGITLPSWQLDLPLPSISVPGFIIRSDFVYIATDIKTLTQAAYEFSFYATHWITSSYSTQYYYLYVQSIGRNSDEINFSVSGLPEGYTYRLYQSMTKIPEYEKFQNYYGILFPNSVLEVYSPSKIITPPGEVNFTITATSQAKLYNNLGAESVSTEQTIKIPTVIDFELDVENEWREPIVINKSNSIPIICDLYNTGNVVDTISLEAVLYTPQMNYTWQFSYNIQPNTIKQSSFNLIFNRNNIYPDVGTYRMVITATSTKNPSLVNEKFLHFNFTAAYDVESSISQDKATIQANQHTGFDFSFTNFGNTNDNFTIQFEAPAELSTYITDLSYQTRVLNLSRNEGLTIPVKFRMSGVLNVTPGIYDFKISAISDGDNNVFSSSIFEVTVLAPELTPPLIEFLGLFNESNSFEVPQSSILNLGYSWRATDQNPGSYKIFINGSLNQTGNWINNEVIYLRLNNLSIGFYQISMMFDDGANSAFNNRTVSIVSQDLVNPVIVTNRASFSMPTNFDLTEYFIWNVTEKHPLNIGLYRNNVLLNPSEYSIIKTPGSENATYSLKIDFSSNNGSFIPGLINYTLVVQDMGNNTVSSLIQIQVTAFDSSSPIINTYPAISGNQNKGEFLTIQATDNNAYNYEFWVNNNFVSNSYWLSGVTFQIDVDSLHLPLGKSVLELRIFDKARNINQYIWNYTLHDVDNPILLSVPLSQVTLYEYNLSYIYAPFWIVQDTNPSYYSIYINGNLVESYNWTNSNNTIRFPVEGLEAGTYIFEGRFFDSTGNMVDSIITVDVLDVTKPFILDLKPRTFEPMFTASFFEFFIVEKHPASYEVYQNGTLIGANSITSDLESILVDMSHFRSGFYNITVNVRDASNNIGESYALVNIADYTPPFIERPSDMVVAEGQNIQITWNINELNPKNYSLYIDSVLQQTGVLTTKLTLQLQNLSLGVHEAILLVYDDSGQSYSSYSLVSVLDLTAPSLNHISDVRFVAGDKNAELIWTPEDLHPDSYIIRRNGVDLIKDTWNGNAIILSLTGWSIGSHTVEILVYDSSGNVATDKVIINLVAHESESTIDGSSGQSSSLDTFFILISFSLFPVISRIRKKQN